MGGRAVVALEEVLGARSSSCRRAPTRSAGGSGARRGRSLRRRSAPGCRRGSPRAARASGTRVHEDQRAPRVELQLHEAELLLLDPTLLVAARSGDEPPVEPVRPRVVGALQRLAAPLALADDRAAVPADVEEGAERVLRSRTSTTGTSATRVATNEPGSDTSPVCPTYCHERRKMRSRSSWRTAGIRVPAPGQGPRRLARRSRSARLAAFRRRRSGRVRRRARPGGPA